MKTILHLAWVVRHPRYAYSWHVGGRAFSAR